MTLVMAECEDPGIDNGWMESIVRQLSIFDIQPRRLWLLQERTSYHKNQQEAF